MKALIKITELTYRPADLLPEEPDILHGINLLIQDGAFVAIVGQNGSGKTTLLKQINGLLLPTQGSVLVNDLDTRLLENRPAILSQVGMVFQNPADQIVASTVEEDVAFGLENANIPTPIIQSRVAEQLAIADLFEDATRPPHLLSDGQIQRLAMAGVLARAPRILLFDEPTSMLDPITRDNFLKRIRQLNRQGMTVVYVTHHIEETVYADQIVVMKDGKVLLMGSPSKIFTQRSGIYKARLDLPETIIAADRFRTIGWDLPENILEPDDLFLALPAHAGGINKSANSKRTLRGHPLITLKNVHYTYLDGTPLAKPALNGATMQIGPSIIHGIAGGNGSGKSTLLQHINGLLRPSSGQIRVGDIILEDQRVLLRDIIQKVGLVFQNPESQFFETYVGDEIAYGPKQLSFNNIREHVRQAMIQVGLDFDTYKDRRLATLSGGEKRKVAIASTLILDQEILLFDEPTAGMDPYSRAELMNLFCTLNQNGKTIVVASHRLEEMGLIAETMSVMRKGIVETTESCQKVISNAQLMKSAGLAPPFTTVVAEKLIQRGWPIDLEQSVTLDGLIQSIEAISQ